MSDANHEPFYFKTWSPLWFVLILTRCIWYYHFESLYSRFYRVYFISSTDWLMRRRDEDTRLWRPPDSSVYPRHSPRKRDLEAKDNFLNKRWTLIRIVEIFSRGKSWGEKAILWSDNWIKHHSNFSDRSWLSVNFFLSQFLISAFF